MAIDCRIDFDIVENVRGFARSQLVVLKDVVKATVSWIPSIECGEKSVERIIDPAICDFMKFFEDGKGAYVTYYDYDRTQLRCTIRSINNLFDILEYERRVAACLDNRQRRIELVNRLYPDIQPYVIRTLAKPQLNPTRVIFNDPATIVFWNDGTKTVVKCSEHDTFTKEGGFAAALAKKMYKTRGIKKILKGSVDQKEEPSLKVKDEWMNDEWRKDLEDKRNEQ